VDQLSASRSLREGDNALTQLTWTQAAPLLQGYDVDVWLSSNERLSLSARRRARHYTRAAGG